MKLKLTSWVALGVAAFFMMSICAAVIPGLIQAKKRQQRIQIQLDLKMLTLAAQVYARDNGGYLPEAGNWCAQLVAVNGTNKESAINPHDLERFLARKQCGYAINSLLAGQKLEVVSSNAVVFYPVLQRGSNLSVAPKNAAAFAWDEHGEMEIVNMENQTQKLRH